MDKEEFINIYNRPEFTSFEKDLREVINTEIALHEIRRLHKLEELINKGEENYD